MKFTYLPRKTWENNRFILRLLAINTILPSLQVGLGSFNGMHAVPPGLGLPKTCIVPFGLGGGGDAGCGLGVEIQMQLNFNSASSPCRSSTALPLPTKPNPLPVNPFSLAPLLKRSRPAPPHQTPGTLRREQALPFFFILLGAAYIAAAAAAESAAGAEVLF